MKKAFRRHCLTECKNTEDPRRIPPTPKPRTHRNRSPQIRTHRNESFSRSWDNSGTATAFFFGPICPRTRASAHLMLSMKNNRENFRILEKPVPSPTIHSQLRSWENYTKKHYSNNALRIMKNRRNQYNSPQNRRISYNLIGKVENFV